MIAASAPSDQRAGVRPISFILDNAGSVSSPVTLVVRPEDLTRNEPSRVAVHQTLGRDVSGWVDHFGEGLPSVTISGHTGWRRTSRGGSDGMGSFESLNNLVQHRFAAAKQIAIESGRDPASVKLLFVDMLDNFAWNVTPTQFVLRRSRSRPLLFQYNISLQAVSTSIDSPTRTLPFFGSVPGGLAALEAIVSQIEGYASGMVGLINEVVAYADGGLNQIAVVVSDFTGLANRAINAAHSVVASAESGASTLANDTIGIAKDLSQVGVNLFRTTSAIVNLPATLRAEVGRVGAAYNEVLCIFSNALRPKRIYEDYEGLYGSSNCSSTTGGRPPSAYSNANPFALMQPQNRPIEISSSAMSSIAAMKSVDPVLAPMPLDEVSRHLTIINDGVALVDLTQ